MMSEILIAILCSIVFILSLIGNALMISVIIRYKRLKNATNYILLSLAIADLTVTFCVMLPATIQDILQEWIWSEFLCKCYIALDITCCTASILHLLLVAIDRYIAIFNPLTYQNMIRKWHIFAMVFMVWTLSFCMSFIPIFLGWNRLSNSNEIALEQLNASNITIISSVFHLKDPALNSTFISDEKKSKVCYLDTNLPYAIISSSLSFYIPLIIMTVVYSQIYVIATRQAKQISQLDIHAHQYTQDTGSAEIHLQTMTGKDNNGLLINQLLQESDITKTDKKTGFAGLIKSLKKIENRRTKEKKAIKTLGIIMGIFTFCWLPFFLMYVAVPLTHVELPIFWERLITWIGYVNSFVNPIVYALTNRDFRKAYIATIETICERCGNSDPPMYNERNRDSFLSQRRINFFCIPHCLRSNKITKSKNTSKTNSPSDNKYSGSGAKNYNQVEKEIIKLIDKESDVIHYIDDTSFSSAPSKKEQIVTDVDVIIEKRSKSIKKKSYLDYNDDEISIDKFLEVSDITKNKIPSSFSNGFLQVNPKKKEKFLLMRQTSENITSNRIGSSKRLLNSPINHRSSTVSKSTNEIVSKKKFESYVLKPTNKSERNSLGKRSLSNLIVKNNSTTKVLSKNDSESILIVRI